jgi:ATP-binding cassette subfamily C (CFTR/MRP) protein 4
LNRFSKDLGQIEEALPLFMYDFLQSTIFVVGVVLLVVVINPWVFIPTVPCLIFFLLLRHYYLRTARCLKRLEATAKSPVFSHVSSTMLGLQTIRAYRTEQTFTQEFDGHQDMHTAAAYLFSVTSRWFAVRLEWLCALFITAVALCSVFAASSLDAGLVGLSLTYALTLMALFQWTVRQSTEIESFMTSVERIVEYSELPPEAALESSESNKPPDDWPKSGRIVAEDICLQYGRNTPVVLSHLNFSIHDQEKVGIVGRTGAGKSSLITALFRLTEPTGKLLIDDIDVLAIGLHNVRKKLSIIPQDPVLLNGTLRKNLDPLNQCSDLQIWHALDQAQLKYVFEELPGGLEAEIHEGGANISMGQRQLVCLARAILKRNRILIIDEATANVDPRTDALIQKTIREQFAHCTVLTIAHRLNTIIDSDRVMVLNEGRIVEFDTPSALLQNPNSLFHKMAQQTGTKEFDRLL